MTTESRTSARPASEPAGAARGPVVLAVIVTVLAWASAFVAIRGVRFSFQPGALALGRLLLGSVALGTALLVGRRWVRPTRREWILVGTCGLTWFALYNVALNTAERHLDAGTAAMLVNVGPILIALLAGAVLGEGFPRWLLIGAGIAFTGAALIAVATTTGGAADLIGVLCCLLAAAAWAVGVMAQKTALRRLPPLQVTAMACGVGTLALLPFSGQLVQGLSNASAGSVIALVYLGLVPTALAFGTWAFALSRMSAGRLGVTTYLVPPLTILLAWPVLGEAPPPLALAGGVLALVGIAVSRRR